MPEVIESAHELAPGVEPGTMLIQLMTPGVGSSGVYPTETLEAAAQDKVFPAGTLMFADHPGETEMLDRPERSIRDVAGVLLEDARMDTGALVARARTFSPWREVITEMRDAIGVSIRAKAELGPTDKASGKALVKRLTEGVSVDFVTRAGRGGSIREVYESARAATSGLVVVDTDAPAVRDGGGDGSVQEALTSARAKQLRDLLTNAVTGAWVRDHDEATRTVIFDVDDADGSSRGTFRQQYEVVDDTATSLLGLPEQVRVETIYVPVTPAGQSTTTESKEDTMPEEHTEVRESGTEVSEADRRVAALESERDTLRRELTEANAAADRAAAAQIVAEADHRFTALETRGLLADLPLTEAGRLDVETFTATVATEAAEAAAREGAGTVRGLGTRSVRREDSSELSEADFYTELAAISGRTVKEA